MIFSTSSGRPESRLVLAFKMLNPADRRKVIIACSAQVGLSVLDIFSVALIGVVVAIGSSGGNSSSIDYVSTILKLFRIDNFSFQSQVMVLGVIAAFTVVIKSILSLIVLRKISYFLSRTAAGLSRMLISKFLASTLIDVQADSLQKSLFSLTSGVANVTQGVIARCISIVTDFATLFSVLIGLFFLDEVIALSSIAIFGLMGLALYLFFRSKAKIAGNLEADFAIRSNQELFEVLGSFRETYVRNRGDYYAESIGRTRLLLSDTLANLGYMKISSKYIMDVAVTLSSLLVAILEFYFLGGSQAIAALGLFLAAGSRLAPAILRIQQNALELRSNLSASEQTFVFHEKMLNWRMSDPSKPWINSDYLGFNPIVEFRNVNFAYSGSEVEILKEITLKISSGQYCAVVGASGAGKTTLVDVMLGLIRPDSGEILISGRSPAASIAKWPGAISYVPQDVQIVQGTIRENVALGYDSALIPEEMIWEALEIARLADFVKTLPLGIDTPAGDRGTRLSGGQRQRLGIARAMFTKPRLLILDEATSALDMNTEEEFASALKNLAGKVTLVVIAHRVSTIKMATVKFVIENGSISKVESQ